MATIDKTQNLVKVIHGANDDHFDIAGLTVSQVHSNLIDAFNIPQKAIAFINGEQVEGTHVILPNDTLEFCMRSGKKGTNRMFTQAEIRSGYTGIPADIIDDLFNNVRHQDTNAVGEPIWLESVVDEWLKECYSRKQVDDGRDRVIPPDGVRLDGKICIDLTTIEWRLMDLLLTRRSAVDQAVTTDEVIEYVWGHGYDRKENALAQHVKRINKKLSEQGGMASVSITNGFVSINK